MDAPKKHEVESKSFIHQKRKIIWAPLMYGWVASGIYTCIKADDECKLI
jgi:hypothetical protein